MAIRLYSTNLHQTDIKDKFMKEGSSAVGHKRDERIASVRCQMQHGAESKNTQTLETDTIHHNPFFVFTIFTILVGTIIT